MKCWRAEASRFITPDIQTCKYSVSSLNSAKLSLTGFQRLICDLLLRFKFLKVRRSSSNMLLFVLLTVIDQNLVMTRSLFAVTSCWIADIFHCWCDARCLFSPQSVMNRMHVISIPYSLMKVNPLSWIQKVHTYKGESESKSQDKPHSHFIC